MISRSHFQKLVEQVRNFPPLKTAIVYPCDRDSLQIALSGQFAGYLDPVLVGPEAGNLIVEALEKYVAATREIAPKIDGRITLR